MSLLRFIACGSVDDGKSTLVGRLLHDAGQIFDDQRVALEADSKRHGTRGGGIDYSLALDGLAAEREQKITIDVAYRHFATPRRRFIVADAPGHEQYTRNMVTGASTAQLAVLLVDASRGLLPQTHRHTNVLSLLGVREVVLAVNKMDLVGFDAARFEAIASAYRAFATKLGLERIAAIPVCAVDGDNVVRRSERMRWYDGPALLEHLESVPLDEDRLALQPFRMPVQWVIRPDATFRGYAGTIAAGRVAPGDRVRVLPSGREATVERIVTAAGDLAEAAANRSVALTFTEALDISRGDLLCAPQSPAEVAHQFSADLVWLGDEPLLRGRDYLMKIGARTVSATVLPLRHKVNVETLEKLAAETLAMNEIGSCELELDRPMAFDPYGVNRDTGGFILIDRLTNDTVAAGMLRFALRRSANVRRQAVTVDRNARARLNAHRSAAIWLTGLSGAGKSTLANRLEARLHALGLRTYLLDGDNLRHGLNKDLGFTPADRVENIRRAGEVTRLMVDAGVIVIAAFISPYAAERRMVRALFAPGEFIEVFVDVPLEVAESRDPKGLYAKARRGEIRNFTGIDSPYERPDSPDFVIDTGALALDEAERRLFEFVEPRLK
ncbi:adenylyl-sulfate kinase [Betaproteobacteria bacterium GR16-43]|nr:adenylyl-sulfate kinase [Betaproteobacteria bacterium GR16-43]